jgi:hypothetical protein
MGVAAGRSSRDVLAHGSPRSQGAVSLGTITVRTRSGVSRAGRPGQSRSGHPASPGRAWAKRRLVAVSSALRDGTGTAMEHLLSPRPRTLSMIWQLHLNKQGAQT